MNTEARVLAMLNKVKEVQAQKQQNLGAIEDAIKSEVERLQNEARDHIDGAYRLYDIIEEFYGQRNDIVSQLESEISKIDMNRVYELQAEIEKASADYGVQFDFNTVEGLSTIEAVLDASAGVINGLQGIRTLGIG